MSDSGYSSHRIPDPRRRPQGTGRPHDTRPRNTSPRVGDPGSRYGGRAPVDASRPSFAEKRSDPATSRPSGRPGSTVGAATRGRAGASQREVSARHRAERQQRKASQSRPRRNRPLPQLPSWSRAAGRAFLGKNPGRIPQGSASQRFVRQWRRSERFRKLVVGAAGLLVALAVGLVILGVQVQGRLSAEQARTQSHLEALGGFEGTLVESYSQTAPLFVQVGAHIGAIQTSGNQCGFYLCTADGQELAAYNAQQPFYSASSIKGPYVLSVLSELQSPDQLGSMEDSVTLAITESDNNSYIATKSVFGTATINQWLGDVGSAETLGDNWGSYVDLSSEQLADLWVESAAWCLGDSETEALHDYGATIFSEPLNSPISQLPDATTWSKPGWIATESQNSTVDAGLVVRDGDAYIMAVMTNKGDDFDTLDPLVISLDNLAQQLIEERASRLV